jgi:pyruvate/2-oxoglutarate dehydrogenase complex dihydrolipoamide dehydrogenase (E3) component
VAQALLELRKDEGIEVLLQSEVLSVTGRSGTGVGLRVRAGDAERTLKASDILVATGRVSKSKVVSIWCNRFSGWANFCAASLRSSS